MKVLIIVFILSVITLVALNKMETRDYEQNLGNYIQNTMDQIDSNPESIDAADDQSGQMHVIGVPQPVTEQWIHRYILTKSKGKDTSSIYTWRWAGKNKIAMSAMGLDPAFPTPHNDIIA